jgi:outer membrane protein OmpA-like peptidoglycan-associated protein
LVLGYATPDFRLFAAIHWTRVEAREPDTDGDGLFDSVDRCPQDPEDLDGHQDEDGCPDPDNDLDRVLDPWVASSGQSNRYADQGQGSDVCPDDPEDVDRHQDEDGCPDPDNDGDRICDPWVAQIGAAPRYAGVCRGADRCPDDPEDIDGFQDEDGCPDPDNDGDGILDPWVAASGQSARFAGLGKGSDRCPDQPETVNGVEDEDGCPDSVVRLEQGAIIILQKVLFYYDATRIKEESFPLLDEVVRVLKEHPELERVRVEGHTDTRGNAHYNRRLSDGRAKAVRAYLVEHGVEATRLEAQGFGEDRPLVRPETGEADYQTNRRVEFNILKRSGP